MYNLLIVDDEQIIADGLYEVFVSIDIPNLHVFKAYSALEALEVLYKIKIDVILLDIRMPEMSGMQLMDMVLRDWPFCRIVFLTGYNDFDYVYKAIRNKGVKYLLKTEGYDKIIETVEEILCDLEESLKIANLSEKAQQYLDLTVKLQQNMYLSSLLDGDDINHEVESDYFSQLGISLDIKKPVLILVGVIDSSISHKKYNERLSCFYSIGMIADQYWNQRVLNSFVIHKNSYMVWLLQPEVSQQFENIPIIKSIWDYFVPYVKGIAENIQSSCRETLKVSVSLAISDESVTWEEVSVKYIMLKHVLSNKFGSGKEMLLTDRHCSNNKSEFENKQNLNWQKVLLRNYAKLDELENYIEHGMLDEVYKLLQELTDPIQFITDMHFNPARELYFTISTRILSFINRYNLSGKLVLKVGMKGLTDVGEMKNWANAIDYLTEVVGCIIDTQSFKQNKRTEELINTLKRYICENLDKDISLIRLAEFVFFNPSYLSRLFKQVTNLNISEYISDKRITRSKLLLQKTKKKINEVAELVGYDTSTNFSRFFKKHTGLSPQEYRNSFCESVETDD